MTTLLKFTARENYSYLSNDEAVKAMGDFERGNDVLVDGKVYNQKHYDLTMKKLDDDRPAL